MHYKDVGEMFSVVVVDDLPELAEGLAALLELDGFDVQWTSSSAVALQLVIDRIPHALISDIEMPGMDGLELAMCTRRLYGDNVFLVAVTGARERSAATDQLFDLTLIKPIAYDALVAALSSAGSD